MCKLVHVDAKVTVCWCTFISNFVLERYKMNEVFECKFCDRYYIANHIVNCSLLLLNCLLYVKFLRDLTSVEMTSGV